MNPNRKIYPFILLFLSSVLFSDAFAQQSDANPLNIHSPNAYQLSKYGDIPVNHSTGVPHINIPLMTLTDKDLKLDISLSYHASGIKVDEEAPWTGLGWSLNAGGVITRVIRGTADLPNAHSNALLRQRTSIPDYLYGQDFVTYRNQTLSKLQLAETNQTDNEPDLFLFNFAGYSGKFFLDENLKPVFFEYRDFKVHYISSPSGTDYPDFIITADDGVVYEFREKEYVYDYTRGANNTTAWYLTKIISPAGGEITFTYWNGGTSRIWGRQYDTHFMALTNQSSQHTVTETVNGMRPNYGPPFFPSVLAEIRTSAGHTIEFNQTGSRLDSDDGSLSEIILKDAAGAQQKKYTLHYSYFEAGNNRKVNPAWGSMEFLNYRLKLDYLREVSNTNNTFLTHSFDYYYNPDPSVNDPYTLPYRLSPSQDHWGYYNYSNNQTIFPNNPANKPFDADAGYVRFLPADMEMIFTRTFLVTGGGTREPHTEAVKAGTLRKITYPAGGYVTFDYEPHGYDPRALSSAGGIRIRQITNSNGEIKTYEYLGNDFISSIYPSDKQNPYYTLYYQNDTEIGQGRPDLMEAFGIPYNVYYRQPFILRMDSRPQAVLGSGPVMVYNYVTERTAGNGRTDYRFSSADDRISGDWGSDLDDLFLEGNFYSGYLTSISSPRNPNGMYDLEYIDSYTWPYPDKVSVDWKRGQLLEKTVYNESGQQIQKDVIEYDLSALRAIPGYKVVSLGESSEFVYARSYTAGGQVRVKKETSSRTMPDGSVVSTVKEYDYGSSSHKKVTEERTWDSEGKLLKTRYSYPTEYTSSLLTALKNKNILTPVDTRVYRENKLIAGTQIQSDDNGNPLTVYKAEPASGVNDIPFNGSNPFTFTPRITSTYHTSGQLRSLKPESEVPVIYLWGYGHQYPIAEITGAAYTDVTSVINQTTLDRIAGSSVLSDADLRLINTLRSALPGALVTTYTYRPLTGMTSMTDPQGVTVYYEYDDFERLKTVRDKDRNLIESYEYNYKNQ